MALTADHLDELRALLGDEGVLASEAARFTYEADALALEHHLPDVVVLPRSTDQVAALMRWAHALGVAVTPRGAGTGLAGGASPARGRLVLSVNRHALPLPVDPHPQRGGVEPRPLNLLVLPHTAQHRLFLAPRPASA